jgi:hypothetical protein
LHWPHRPRQTRAARVVPAVSMPAALTSRAAVLGVVDFAEVAAALEPESQLAWLPVR